MGSCVSFGLFDTYLIGLAGVLIPFVGSTGLGTPNYERLLKVFMDLP
jgi:hypothetical protein